MKLRLFTKLFLAMLLSLAIPLGAMMASVHWSFRQGFSDYLHQVELERLAKLIELLGQAYREHGTWNFLKDKRRLWINLVRQGLAEKPGETLSEADESFRGRPPPQFGYGPPPPAMLPPGAPPRRPGHPPPRPPDPLFLGVRLRLLDGEHKPVILPPPAFSPNKRDQQPLSMLPIVVDNVTVGFVGLERSGIVSDRLALAFVGQQSRSNLLILVLALTAAALASLILARQIIRPLRRIAAGTKTLASGHYDVSIPVTGDELGDLARDFNLLALTLKRNEQARRRWIADISHELRTPLAVLRGEIEALHDGVRSQSPERIASLHGEVLSLSKLVDDLYELSLSDLGALNYRRETVDLAEVLTQAVDSFRSRFESKHIHLNSRIEKPIAVHADRQRLAQLFTNLLENSYRYTDPGGRCEIDMEISADVVAVTIEDSAPGVPANTLGKLFDRLFRVDRSRSREHGGAGLGLAICKNIAEAHSGRISARSSRWGGLCVRIELPRRMN